MWLRLSTVFCTLAGLGNIALVLAVLGLATRDGTVTTNEAEELVILTLAAMAWVYIAIGVYKREVRAYRRARLWIGVNILFHVIYVVGGHRSGLISIPFEVLALVALVKAKSDFNLVDS